ncbi:MAG: hypothetical protein H7839_05605 [Magnetococcus sp. YQC-5]
MAQTVTIDDIWRMLQESDRQRKELFREDRERWKRLDRKVKKADRKTERRIKKTDRKTERRLQETDRLLKETDRILKETDRILKETGLQMKETDRRLQETDRMIKEIGIKMQETDRQMEETDRRMQETDRKLKETSTLVGNLGRKWGDFVEGLVAPACATLFTQRGIPVHKVSRQVKRSLPGGRNMEIDVLVENTDTVALVEVKSTLTIEYVREHLKRLSECKHVCPEYANKRMIGAVAGIVIDENADQFAMNHGLFVIKQAGDQVRLVNESDFVPREW